MEHPIKNEKTPELAELDWRRVAWGAALVEALARQPFGVVEKARKPSSRTNLSREQWRREREAIGAYFLDRISMQEGAKRLDVGESSFMVLLMMGLEEYARDVDTSILEGQDGAGGAGG